MSRIVTILSALVLVGALLPVPAALAQTPHLLTGRVWGDLDLDARQDANEKGYPGVTIQLLTSPGRVLVKEMTTGVDGVYETTTTETGFHVVRVVLGRYERMTSRDSVDDAIDSDFGHLGEVEIYLGEIDHDLDAGLLRDAIGGVLFLDRDADVRRDDGEGPLPGVTVELRLAIDPTVVVRSGRTDKRGRFSLLVPHAYANNTLRVRVVMSDGLARNPFVPEGNESYLDPTNTSAIHVPHVWRELQFGLLQPVRVGDRVWNDRDGDGRQDAGEKGVPGVLVSLLRESSSVVVDTDTTDAMGRFRVKAPSPGRYFVFVRSPNGKYTRMRTDLPEGVDSDVRSGGAHAGESLVLTLVKGGHRRDIDAGVRIP